MIEYFYLCINVIINNLERNKRPVIISGFAQSGEGFQKSARI